MSETGPAPRPGDKFSTSWGEYEVRCVHDGAVDYTFHTNGNQTRRASMPLRSFERLLRVAGTRAGEGGEGERTA